MFGCFTKSNTWVENNSKLRLPAQSEVTSGTAWDRGLAAFQLERLMADKVWRAGRMLTQYEHTADH